MKFKKSWIFICLIIVLFSAASVSAADMDENGLASENQNQETLEVDDMSDETFANHDLPIDDGETAGACDVEKSSLNENDVEINCYQDDNFLVVSAVDKDGNVLTNGSFTFTSKDLKEFKADLDGYDSITFNLYSFSYYDFSYDEFP